MTRFYKPYTPGTRHRSVSDFKKITACKPYKQLTGAFYRAKGRNNRGIITSRYRGGGHKRLYRQIDFKRRLVYVPGVVQSIEYDPNRNARIAQINYLNGFKKYILHAAGLKLGQTVIASPQAAILRGNCLPLARIPLGAEVHNIECCPGGGGKLVRSAGASARVVAKEKRYTTLRLPSGEVRFILQNCWATIGRVGNEDSCNQTRGKAGVSRWLDQRPKVRGSAMNPCDHRHGGGEGRCPVGIKQPVSLWGKPALGVRTRPAKKYSRKAIIRRRRGFHQ